MNSFWEKVTDGIDEKYINDTVDLHIRKMPPENILVPVEYEVPPPVSRKTLIIRTAVKIAAALAVVIGIGAVLKANDISISEMWAARPSQTTAADTHPLSETTTSDDEKLHTTTIEIDPSVITTSVLPYNTTVPGTLTEPTTYLPDDRIAITTTSIEYVDEPAAVTGFALDAPAENYLAEYDLESNPPRILYARDTYCVFAMADGVMCYYDMNMAQLVGLYDISGRLAKTNRYDSKSVQISVYLDENGVPVFAVTVERIDGTGYDNYTVEFAYHTASLAVVTDEKFFDALTPYEGITLSQQVSTDGFRAEFDAGYTTGYVFLRDSGNRGMRGAYRLEIICNTKRDGSEIFIPFDDPEYELVAQSGYPALDMLGGCYFDEEGLYHVSNENWEICDDYELFRKFFFGVWNEHLPTIIDDSESTEFADVNRFFMDFYKVSNNVLAFTTGGSAGGMLYWIDMNNPDMLIYTYGSPGDFPDGIASDELGEPLIFGLAKSDKAVIDTSAVELMNGYLSVFRLREIAKEYGIDYSMLVDFEFETEDGTQYHDDRYYFYSMYLVSESENRLELRTTTGNGETVYEGEEQARVTVVIEKINGEWVRTITEAEPNPAGNYAEQLRENPIFSYNGSDYYADSMAGNMFIMDDDGNIIREEYYNSSYYPSALNLDKIVTGVTNLNQLTEISPEIYTHYDAGLTYYDIGFGMVAAVRNYDFYPNGIISGIEPLMKKYPEDWFYKIYTFSSEEHIPEHTEVFIDKNLEQMDIEFLTDEQDRVFYNALYLMSGQKLNPELSFETPGGTDRFYEGWYVSDIAYYDYWYGFFSVFGSEYRADEMADKFGFRCVNGRLAWKGYEYNTVYEDAAIVEFELIEKAENKVRFKAIVVYEGGVEKEYEYELESYDGTNWHMSEFELWDKP